MASFTILTLNTWKCDGDYVRRLQLMADALAALDPDVIMLQEVFASADGAWDTSVHLAEVLDMRRAYHPARFKKRCVNGTPSDSYSGLAVLSHGRQRDHHAFPLPGTDGDGDRWAQSIVIETEGQPVRVVNTHLTHVDGGVEGGGADGDGARLKQARRMIEVLGTGPKDIPTIVGGDFNAELEDPAMQWILAQDAMTLHRIDMNRPTLSCCERCVDHLLVAPPLGVSQVMRVMDQPANDHTLPSDHHGIMARLVFPN